MSDLVFRLRERARIRRQIPTRKSVQNNEPDRIAELLDEAANELTATRERLAEAERAAERQWVPVSEGGHETRNDKNGILDEFIVNNPKHVHLERMDRHEWWIGIDALDGTTHHIRFSANPMPRIETEEPSRPVRPRR